MRVCVSVYVWVLSAAHVLRLIWNWRLVRVGGANCPQFMGDKFILLYIYIYHYYIYIDDRYRQIDKNIYMYIYIYKHTYNPPKKNRNVFYHSFGLIYCFIFFGWYYVYIYMCVCVYAQLYADSSSSCGKSASNPHFWLLWCVSHAFWLPFLVFVVSRCFKGLGLRYLSISFYYPLVI
jgi:hypothetical protein